MYSVGERVQALLLLNGSAATISFLGLLARCCEARETWIRCGLEPPVGGRRRCGCRVAFHRRERHEPHNVVTLESCQFEPYGFDAKRTPSSQRRGITGLLRLWVTPLGTSLQPVLAGPVSTSACNPENFQRVFHAAAARCRPITFHSKVDAARSAGRGRQQVP